MIALSIFAGSLMIYNALFLASERIAKAIEGVANNLDQMDDEMRRKP